MGETIRLTAADGHGFDCYRAEPQGNPRGALLVIQEIFGVNSHMRGVTDGFARDGYLALCPALFDRATRNFEVGYTPEDIEKGRNTRMQVPWEAAVMDMAATTAELTKSGGKVGAVGYCWGGSLAWLTATRLDGIAASVCYYGGAIGQFKDEKPTNPVMMHFGETDHSIPMQTVEDIRKAQPGAIIHVYPAGHGFNCEQRKDYNPDAARLARERSLAFFQKHVG